MYLQNTIIISRNISRAIIVKIFVLINNPQITNAQSFRTKSIISSLSFLQSSPTEDRSKDRGTIKESRTVKWKGLSMLVVISETIRLLLTIIISFGVNKINKLQYHTNMSLRDNRDEAFNEWLAGLIDGDGCFLLSKKGYASLEIVMDIRDRRSLYLIKQKFGGSIKIRSGINYLRYRLHHKEGLLKLIEAINGLIRNPVRIAQLARICEKYSIEIIMPKELVYDNGWLSGFIDSDGSIYFNLQSVQLFITASQKNKLLLDPLVSLYGGTIYFQKQTNAYKWTVYKKQEVLNLLEYFNKYPLRSAKHVRIGLIKDFYYLIKLGAHRASDQSIMRKLWNKFETKWNRYEINS